MACLAELQAAGVQLNAVACSAVISVCQKGQQWERAVSFLGEMRNLRFGTTLASLHATNNNTTPFEKLEQRRQQQPAADLAGATAPAGSVLSAPDVIGFNASMSACAQGHQWQRALAVLFDDMAAHAVLPDTEAACRIFADFSIWRGFRGCGWFRSRFFRKTLRVIR
eukprot:TRINITY_DN47157_c0_g2_i1.p1 TRINITY_DN47157_c0_g2~~TRINITY_DN47157_c0_g2_i1.p1  ORF type:complete len:167 (+),score=20.34 TRINITY_DN47157_c0_g2_i1:194-694(+)